MTKEIDEQKVSMVNELIFLTQEAEDLWKYHPNNPNSSNLLEDYAKLKQEISELEKEIEEI